MVYLILSKNSCIKSDIIQIEILNFCKEHIKNNNFNYKLIFCKDLLLDSEISHIDKINDIILWEPKMAHYNMEILKTFKNSIVILEKPTIYLQKISEYNYINENKAINNGFYILYIYPEKIDITNNDYKLVVTDETFIITTEKLINFIKSFSNNIKNLK
jgi:hypothetical protein